MSTCWYGKRGRHHFCSSHRAAWERWRKDDDAEEDEERYVTDMNELLGTRNCEPSHSQMKAPEKYNDVKKNALQFCVQGTFTAAGYARGAMDTRWQTVDELSKSCSREDFERLAAAYVKEPQKSLRRDAKRFKPAAELESD